MHLVKFLLLNYLLFLCTKQNDHFFKMVILFIYYSKSNFICTSFNCSSATALGALINKSLAFLFFGNAITPLRLSSPAINITILSTPGAAPACGGVPYWYALNNAPKRCYTSFFVYPAISNAFTISSGLWLRTAPDAISYPLHTKSY